MNLKDYEIRIFVLMKRILCSGIEDIQSMVRDKWHFEHSYNPSPITYDWMGVPVKEQVTIRHLGEYHTALMYEVKGKDVIILSTRSKNTTKIFSVYIIAMKLFNQITERVMYQRLKNLNTKYIPKITHSTLKELFPKRVINAQMLTVVGEVLMYSEFQEKHPVFPIVPWGPLDITKMFTRTDLVDAYTVDEEQMCVKIGNLKLYTLPFFQCKYNSTILLEPLYFQNINLQSFFEEKEIVSGYINNDLLDKDISLKDFFVNENIHLDRQIPYCSSLMRSGLSKAEDKPKVTGTERPAAVDLSFLNNFTSSNIEVVESDSDSSQDVEETDVRANSSMEFNFFGTSLNLNIETVDTASQGDSHTSENLEPEVGLPLAGLSSTLDDLLGLGSLNFTDIELVEEESKEQDLQSNSQPAVQLNDPFGLGPDPFSMMDFSSFNIETMSNESEDSNEELNIELSSAPNTSQPVQQSNVPVGLGPDPFSMMDFPSFNIETMSNESENSSEETNELQIEQATMPNVSDQMSDETFFFDNEFAFGDEHIEEQHIKIDTPQIDLQSLGLAIPAFIEPKLNSNLVPVLQNLPALLNKNAQILEEESNLEDLRHKVDIELSYPKMVLNTDALEDSDCEFEIPNVSSEGSSSDTGVFHMEKVHYDVSVGKGSIVLQTLQQLESLDEYLLKLWVGIRNLTSLGSKKTFAQAISFVYNAKQHLNSFNNKKKLALSCLIKGMNVIEHSPGLYKLTEKIALHTTSGYSTLKYCKRIISDQQRSLAVQAGASIIEHSGEEYGVMAISESLRHLITLDNVGMVDFPQNNEFRGIFMNICTDLTTTESGEPF